MNATRRSAVGPVVPPPIRAAFALTTLCCLAPRCSREPTAPEPARQELALQELALQEPALQEPAGGGVLVRVVDADDRPLAGAVVFTLPQRAMQWPIWIPPDLTAWFGNPFELLRRLGTRHVASAAGTVMLPAASMAAGEHGDLAGIATIAARRHGAARARSDAARRPPLRRHPRAAAALTIGLPPRRERLRAP